MITRYVNTASSAGGDGTTNNTSGSTRAYHSLAEALAPLHLTTLADRWQIYCSGATADDGTGGGSTLDHTAFEFYTSPTNYMEIFGDNTTGKWNTSAYRVEVTNKNCIYNQYAAHIRLYDIQTQVKITNAGSYNGQRLATANNDTSLGTGYQLFKGCISRVDPTSTNGRLDCFSDSIIGAGSGTCDHVNCLAIGLVGTVTGNGFLDDGSAGKFYWNCTAANSQYGFQVSDTCKNNLATGCTFGWISNGASSDYNATDDGNGVPNGTNNRAGVTFTFVDAANGDYHLASGDAGAKGYGLTDPASGLYSDDIDGFPRGAVWDIGFDEYALLLEQEGFRWGVDDGSESAHTWEANQDTSISIADTQARLLRVLVNATGDPAATAYTLRVQKNGVGGYVKVNVGATSSPTLSYGAAGTIAYSASGGTSVVPTYPTGITTNSCLVLVVGQKPSSANGGSVTTPSGWTLQGQNTGATDGDTGGYTTTLGADTGNTNIYVYTKDTVLGTESGTLTVTVATNNVCWANIYRIESSDVATWSYAVGVGKDTTGGNVSIATGSMAIAAGDYILAGMVIPTDVTTPAQFSAEALSQSGTTFGTVTEVQEPDSGTGNDIGGFIVEALVSSGSGSGAVTLTATAGGTTTNVRGPGFVFRARAASVTNEVYIDASANIAAGGEATTARLTAPSGKTTSDFVTGRRWDDENGTDTIDVTIDDYTEVEWKVALSSTPVANDYYDFRVYAGATNALDTYTQLPRWTVPSAGGGAFPFQSRHPMAHMLVR